MHFEERHGFSSGQRYRHVASASQEPLPRELAFLEGHGVQRTVLDAAAIAARRAEVSAAGALIAGGHVSASCYYRALAAHLDVAYIDDWPDNIAVGNVASALALGQIAFVQPSPLRWLAAPRGEELRRLLSTKRAGLRRLRLAITTPAHLAALIHYRAQRAVERSARDVLPDAHPRLSARGATDRRSALAAVLTTACILVGLVVVPRVVGLMAGLLFFCSISFRLGVAAAGLEPRNSPLRPLADAELPVYSVLVPLRDEGDILPDLLVALEAIDYPRAKLEVLVLIEPEDLRTRRALRRARLPPWLHVVFGPWGGGLRTKPRALNIGLLTARGSLLTVFDAEDRPDPDQLRRAAAMFASLPERVACLQARLAIDNGARSLLARMFAIEYAFLFDILNVGIGSLRLPMALGGTSNHFRTAVLRDVGGWDAWNVTEDADLGLRLARLGFDVACLPSTTLEVAPEKAEAWMRQRRRWLKGWMQTFLVLARDAPRLARQLGVRRSGALVLLLVNLVLGPLLFPIFSAYVTYRFIEVGLPSPSSALELVEATIGASVVVIGAAATLWCGYVATRARKLGAFLPIIPLLLPYQLMISAAAWLGLIELIRRPYHWHKTDHAARSDETGLGV